MNQLKGKEPATEGPLEDLWLRHNKVTDFLQRLMMHLIAQLPQNYSNQQVEIYYTVLVHRKITGK
jgi:hypothetical protein